MAMGKDLICTCWSRSAGLRVWSYSLHSSFGCLRFCRCSRFCLGCIVIYTYPVSGVEDLDNLGLPVL
jgi:hypothetical protein